MNTFETIAISRQMAMAINPWGDFFFEKVEKSVFLDKSSNITNNFKRKFQKKSIFIKKNVTFLRSLQNIYSQTFSIPSLLIL